MARDSGGRLNDKSQPIQIARALVMAFAVAAFVMRIASGPGTRMGLWHFETGFALLKWAAYTGIGAGIGALVLIVLMALPRWRHRPWVPILALCFALAAAVPPVLLLEHAKGTAPIHDVTTDIFDPPVFQALLPERQKAPNGAAYAGMEVAKGQQKAYPDIHTVVLKVPPDKAMQLAIDAARSSGWDIAASDSAAGRIEATATRRRLGSKADLVARIRPG